MQADLRALRIPFPGSPALYTFRPAGGDHNNEPKENNRLRRCPGKAPLGDAERWRHNQDGSHLSEGVGAGGFT